MRGVASFDSHSVCLWRNGGVLGFGFAAAIVNNLDTLSVVGVNQLHQTAFGQRNRVSWQAKPLRRRLSAGSPTEVVTIAVPKEQFGVAMHALHFITQARDLNQPFRVDERLTIVIWHRGDFF